MDFLQFITQSGLIIAAALFIVGVFLKKATFIPDWTIPFILLALGILAAGFSMEGGFIVANILQGVFAAGAAVLAKQIQKQTTTRDPGDAYETQYSVVSDAAEVVNDTDQTPQKTVPDDGKAEDPAEAEKKDGDAQ